ncbi:transposase family protein [Gemmata sp. G18]|uniref:Transposase family protein n=1 Tax=Gemmata palustris TaxID=2822762 RepID=A0ABS5C3C4_9BACT|nr:transposase family protein [Gemmata palustris]
MSLAEVLATILDPRDPSGRWYPLPVVLNLVVVAALAGMHSLEAVAQFARITEPAGTRSGVLIRPNPVLGHPPTSFAGSTSGRRSHSGSACHRRVTVGYEVPWVIRTVLSGRVVLAEALLSAPGRSRHVRDPRRPRRSGAGRRGYLNYPVPGNRAGELGDAP